MAGSVRITKVKFHNDGFDELRKSGGIAGELAVRGRRIAAAAGGFPKFDVIVTQNKSRARVIVVTANAEGMEDEQKDRALTRALDAGRG